jgi:hypothetical protein
MTIMALKHDIVKKSVSIHISTSLSLYLSDVEHHNHLLLGPNVPTGDLHGISPFLASQQVPANDLLWACACSPHLRLP